MKKISIALLIATLLLTGCATYKAQEGNKVSNNNSNKVTEEGKKERPSNNSNKDNTSNGDNSLNENTNSNGDTSSNEDNNLSGGNEGKNDSVGLENISEKVKEYILNGQGNKPETQKLKWSKLFLNEVNIQALYNEYVKSSGNADNIEEFASFVTKNAPILSNWEDLFKKDLLEAYGEEVVKVEHLEGDLYQAYVKKEGKDVPYVVVSSRTGYFHG